MIPSDPPASVRVGEVLAGKYRIDAIVGTGGMGVVAAAHHLQLDERVALKFLLPQALDNAEAVSRFQQEARAAVKIKSEHVARVIDVGALDNGAPYIVMEFLEGRDLAAWLQEKGPLPVEQAAEFLLQACEAIAEAHALGIIHRDLKPANIFVVQRNDGSLAVKVLDFGISKVSASGPEITDTRTNAVMGSPFYMSPEQLRSSRDVDPRSDIWALGVMLYELLSGQSPFYGNTFSEVCVKITVDPPPSLRSLRSDVPAALEGVIAKCLEKKRSDRYPDVAALAVALGEFAPAHARASVGRILKILQHNRTPSALPSNATGASDEATIAPFGHTLDAIRAMRGKRKGTAAAGFALCLALLGGGAMLYSGTVPRWLASGPSGAGLVSVPPPSGTTVAAAALAGVPLTPALGELPAPSAAPTDSSTANGSGSASPASTGVPMAARHAAVQPWVPPTRASATTAHVRLLDPPLEASREPAPQSAPSAAVSAPTRAPAASCDPPFYFDADGIRVFKKECVR